VFTSDKKLGTTSEGEMKKGKTQFLKKTYVAVQEITVGWFTQYFCVLQLGHLSNKVVVFMNLLSFHRRLSIIIVLWVETADLGH